MSMPLDDMRDARAAIDWMLEDLTSEAVIGQAPHKVGAYVHFLTRIRALPTND